MGKRTVKCDENRTGSSCPVAAKFYESIALGKSEAAEMYAQRLFEALRCHEDIEEIRRFYIDIYAQILVRSVRRSDAGRMKEIAHIAVSESAGEMQAIILKTMREIVAENAPEYTGGYNALIRETLHIINENIGNEVLSLRWIAGTILYTNVDYLGKLFKKEIGQNFSHYVMEKRMKLAMRLLSEGDIDKIYEVAERVGYGSNSQYFSQVFKKYTGASPLEYREAFKKKPALPEK